MNWDIRYSHLAEEDILKIYRYIARAFHDRESAAGQAMRIVRAARSLENMPLRHRLYEDEPWHSLGLRIMPVDNYVVLYWPDEMAKIVHIARIVYGKMDIPAQLDFEEIRLFIGEGMKDLEAGNIRNAEDVFEELRERYKTD